MSLNDGDYITIQNHLVSAINADTAAGGLKEGADPPVKTVEAELGDEPRVFRNHETPAIVAAISDKTERPDSGATLRTYNVAFFIYCRGLDSESEIAQCQRIAHRLEELLREENAPDRQLNALPDSLAWSLGALDITPSETEFLAKGGSFRGPKKFSALGIVRAELEIPAKRY